MFRAVLFLSLALAAYTSGNSIRENSDDITIEAVPNTLDALSNSNFEAPEKPTIVTLQGLSPPRQCAGVGQACSGHGDCCTNSCFGLLRSCVPNLGFSLNLQIGSPTGS